MHLKCWCGVGRAGSGVSLHISMLHISMHISSFGMSHPIPNLFTDAELRKVHHCGVLARRIARKWDRHAEEDKLDRKVDLHT